MGALALQLCATPDQRLDLSGLTPERLDGLSEAEIAGLPVNTTKAALTAGDVFKITMGDAEHLRFMGLDGRCDRVGAAMQHGEITVEGDVGAYAGVGLAGGRLTITGSAGPFAGAGLAGGLVEIGGDAGERAGAPDPMSRYGMRGGVLHIRGNAGAEAGDRMRRGLMIVGGDAGPYAGARMIAGTLVVGGRAGRWPGYGMRRGTLVLGAPPEELLPTFLDGGAMDLGVLRLLRRELAALGAAPEIASRVRRFAGDMAALGKGEILMPACQ